MSEIILRHHQEHGLNMLRHALSQTDSNGRKVRRVIFAASCGYGKTITAAHIIKSAVDNGKKVMFICDRIKLVNQTLATLDKYRIDCGVQQGQHERCKPWADAQIASVQTLRSRNRMPDADIYIIDEAHTHYQYYTQLMATMNACMFISLTATPYSKGLGLHYQSLVVPITPRELEGKGYLTPITYYVGHSASLKGVGSQALPTGGSDYRLKDLEKAIDGDDILTGDIIKTWLKYGEDSQTISFCPSIKTSKWLVQQFNEAGIPAHHIDAYTDPDERELIYAAHDRGEFKILSCSQLLSTGYDSPTTRVMIDCYSTRSLITWVQRCGRIARIADNKPYAIVLDHSGNHSRHGRAEDVVPTHLDDGEKEYKEADLAKKDENKEAKERACPKCYSLFIGACCACGWELPSKEILETDGGELVKLSDMNAAEKRNHKESAGSKDLFLAGLVRHGVLEGHKHGWAAHQYKARYGIFPKGDSVIRLDAVPADVKKFIRGQQIRRAYANKARA